MIHNQYQYDFDQNLFVQWEYKSYIETLYCNYVPLLQT